MPGLDVDQMRSAAIIALTLIPLILLGRTWTDTKGRSFEGDLISFDGNQAIIQRNADQRLFYIDSSTLSQEDRTYLSRQITNDQAGAMKVIGLVAGSITLIFSMAFVGKRMNLMDWGIGRSLMLIVVNIAIFVGFGIGYGILHALAGFPQSALPLVLLLSVIGMIIGSAIFTKEGLLKILTFLFLSHAAALIVCVLFTVGSAALIEEMNQR